MPVVLHLMETSGPGGAETVALELMRRLNGARWRSLAVVYDEGWLTARLAEERIPYVVLPERGAFDLRYLQRLVSIVRAHGVDLIHAHLFGATIRAGLAGALSRAAAIGTLHGDVDLAADERFRTLKRTIVRRGVRRLTFVSESLRRQFLDRLAFPDEMCVVIPNGIDVSRYAEPRRDAARRELNLPTHTFVVGAVGNLNAAKGYDVLLRAAAILRSRGDDWRFVVVGDDGHGRQHHLFELRAALGLENHVTFTGFRSDVPALLSAFDAYVLTSRSEGFSLAVVEAMAAGLPVVATRCGGPEQIIDDGRTGLLVENGSPEAVADALEALRADAPRREALASAARSAVRERFDIDATMARYEQLYVECLASRS
jgi:glycosyltransferase involved in cell wall biosynthesis